MGARVYELQSIVECARVGINSANVILAVLIRLRSCVSYA